MSSEGPSLAEKLANVQHMPCLIAATVASDKPTDGYLVRDIIKISYESAQARVFLQKYLINTLTSSNVFVKIKVLKLVINLLDEGHPDFHRNLQKTPEPFKSASMLKASNIDLAGDCGRIRDLANKVLDKLFDEPPDARACPYGAPPTSSSYSPSTSSNRTSSSVGDGRIQGFGTSPSSSSSNESTLKSISNQISNAVGSLLGSSNMTRSSNQRSLLYDESYATMSYVPLSTPGMGGAYGGAEPLRNDWEETKAIEQVNSSSNTSSNNEGSIEQERRLVDDITAPGGVRVAPTRDAINTFISRCKSLDCSTIVECLKVKLKSDSSQTVMKSMFVIEALIRSDIPNILTYLDTIIDELHHLSSSSDTPSIRAKAAKLMSQLNAIENISKPPDVTNELLISQDDDSNQSNDNVSGLFAGLNLTSSTATTAVTAPSQVRHKQIPAAAASNTLAEISLTNAVQSDKSTNDLLDFSTSGNDDFDPLTGEGPGSTSNIELLRDIASLDDTTPFMEPLLLPSTTIGQPLGQTSMGQTSMGQTSMGQPSMGQPLMGQPSMGQPLMGQQTYPFKVQQSDAGVGNYYSVAANRPVQRFPTSSETGSTGFGFLSKTSKGSAFDFVQDEMKASLKP